MARKVTVKNTVQNETVANQNTDEQIIATDNAQIEKSVHETEKETPIVTSVKVVDYLILDENNEIVIEKTSDFWIHAYWSNGEVSFKIAEFEINHSTTNDDIIKTVRRYARDRFTYLAEKTFVAQPSTSR